MGSMFKKKEKKKKLPKTWQWKMLEQHLQQYEEHDGIGEDKPNTDDYGWCS